LGNRHAKDRWVRRAVAQNLSTVDALNLERTLIVCDGRKDIGTGVLVNKNNGIGIDLRTLSTPEAIVPKSLARSVFISVLLFCFVLAGALLMQTQPILFFDAAVANLVFAALAGETRPRVILDQFIGMVLDDKAQTVLADLAPGAPRNLGLVRADA